ncbi:hypothetical protein [Siccirubricoccus phaeus]|uniref:hypothetical protein n=1 Tax=Siccirubricoccus phaeus TaxID=2595053 RepID=UPI0011F172D1|nr:hypothetical protein [Siccirubricoccus phaeus]
MTEGPDTQDEGPEDPDENAEDEMSADGRALLDAYLLRLAEEGARDIERGDFVVARTPEELRRILWDDWTPPSGEIKAG